MLDSQSAHSLCWNAGYVVAAYGAGVEALAIFQREPDRFDLRISNQTMPVITGTRLLESMRRLRADLPVVVGIGYRDMLDQDNANQAAYSSVRRKPFTLVELSHTIVGALSARN